MQEKWQEGVKVRDISDDNMVRLSSYNMFGGGWRWAIVSQKSCVNIHNEIVKVLW